MDLTTSYWSYFPLNTNKELKNDNNKLKKKFKTTSHSNQRFDQARFQMR
jgi:hypothetical protein